MALLDGCERYEPNDDEMKKLFDTEREINVDETSDTRMRAAA